MYFLSAENMNKLPPRRFVLLVGGGNKLLSNSRTVTQGVRTFPTDPCGQGHAFKEMRVTPRLLKEGIIHTLNSRKIGRYQILLRWRAPLLSKQVVGPRGMICDLNRYAFVATRS
mgnify:CR=1 FL=1